MRLPDVECGLPAPARDNQPRAAQTPRYACQRVLDTALRRVEHNQDVVRNGHSDRLHVCKCGQHETTRLAQHHSRVALIRRSAHSDSAHQRAAHERRTHTAARTGFALQVVLQQDDGENHRDIRRRRINGSSSTRTRRSHKSGRQAAKTASASLQRLPRWSAALALPARPFRPAAPPPPSAQSPSLSAQRENKAPSSSKAKMRGRPHVSRSRFHLACQLHALRCRLVAHVLQWRRQ